MRLTRLGFSVLVAEGFALFGALASGNNLLNLVAGLLAAALIAAALANRRHTAGLGAALEFPDPAFCGVPLRAGIVLRNPRRRAAWQIDIVVPGARRTVGRLGRGESIRLEIPYTLPRRGRNRVNNIRLETGFPFGFFRSSRLIAASVVTAFPSVFEIYGRAASPAVHTETVSRPQRGVGDDFHGIRDYSYGEDARLINWKLTAKSGRPLVKEYAQSIANRVTVTAAGASGPGAEARIAEAASLVRFFIDAGAEVRLVTDEGKVGYGRGLLHLRILLEKLALLGEGKIPADAPPLRPFASRPRPAPPKSLIAPLYLTTAAAFASLFLIEDLSPLFLARAALLLPVGWFFDRRGIYPLPRAALDAAAVLVLVFILFGDLPASGLIRTVSHLLLFILSYFLWTPKTDRTLKRILLVDFLIFFLASGQAVDLVYGPVFVAFFLAAGVWLARWHDPPEQTVGRRSRLHGVPAVAARTFAAAAILFLVLPRMVSPRMQQLLASTGLSRFQNPLYSFAGLSDRVDLGFFGPLRKNSARALRVGFVAGPPGFRPPPVLRIRAAAFDSFAGRRWVRTPGEFMVRTDGGAMRSRGGIFRLRNRRGRIALPPFDPQTPVVVEDVFVYPMIASFVFGSGGIEAIETDAYSASFDVDDTFYFANLYARPARYRVLCSTDGPRNGRFIVGYDDLLRTKFLSLDRPDPRWRQFASDRTAAVADPVEKARALENYFRTRFAYSASAADNRRDLDDFLWTTRAANCEYFATAMALLLRHIGIPSRLVVGFLTDEWNEIGEFFDVRQSDAHAWVEAYFSDRGWVAFDPTPPDLDGTGNGILAAAWRRVHQYLGALEAVWYRYVVGFDSITQHDLLAILRVQFGRFAPALGILLGAAAATAAVVYIRTRPGRRKRPRRRRAADDFYRPLLDRLERAGFPRPPWQTARAYAADVILRRPDLAEFGPLTETFYEVRYAGRMLAAGEPAAARRTAERLRAALRRRRRPQACPERSVRL